MSKISAVVSAYNAEDKIEDCLESVKWCNEIVLIDNSSTDKTAEKAKKYTSKIFKQPNNLMLNVNKNFGFSKASEEWIINLDSDESLSVELILEIKEILKNNSIVDGFWIPRKNIIFGKWIKHAGWYPDYQLRLFRKGKGKFEEKHVHELIKINGETDHLKENIIHYNYESVSQFLSKLSNIYAPNEAEALIKGGYELNWLDAIRFPSKEFLSRFFARQGYKDGMHGLVISLLMAFYHLVVFTMIWEKKGFQEQKLENILEETEKEFRQTGKEMKFWFFKEKAVQTNNNLKKVLLKIQSKF